jgi:hypothetical protein
MFVKFRRASSVGEPVQELLEKLRSLRCRFSKLFIIFIQPCYIVDISWVSVIPLKPQCDVLRITDKGIIVYSFINNLIQVLYIPWRHCDYTGKKTEYHYYMRKRNGLGEKTPPINSNEIDNNSNVVGSKTKSVNFSMGNTRFLDVSISADICDIRHLTS